MKRASGVLLPIFSLPGEYSCGALGREARDFVDLLADCGFSWWQTLPLCLPGEGDSPYKSYASASLNYAFIDLPSLFEEGLITEAELMAARQESPYLCEYERIARERFPLLARAAARLTDRAPVEAFLEANPSSEAFCRFMALREKNGGRPFPTWTEQEPDPELVFAWGFTQYTFLRQWNTLRAYAASRGVRILGDMPIYVDYDSADVRENPHLFDLRDDLSPAAVAGVPPDCFSADGQLWGNPLYDWDAMKRENYGWWRARMAGAARLFDGVRIDHFRAFASYYRIPAEAPSARGGEWIKGPGRELTDLLTAAAPDCLIIAEDLGGNTPDVRALLEESGFPGMRVLQFAFSEGHDNFHMPHNYEKNCVAYTGTHDNDTLLGYLFALDSATRRRFFDYCGYAGEDIDAGMPAAIHTMLASHAGLCILPLQDLLGFGTDTRINRPGTPRGNWVFRTTADQLALINRDHWRALNERFCR